MDNFNLKQYLVENKLTYQEKMKDKAKKLKSKETTSKDDLKEMMGKYWAEPFASHDTFGNDFYDSNNEKISKDQIESEEMETFGPGEWNEFKSYVGSWPVKWDIFHNQRMFDNYAKRGNIVVVRGTRKTYGDETKPTFEGNSGKGTEQEKGHQAPKDKQKQGPSTMNEAEGKVKINFVKKAEFNDINDKYDTKKGGRMSDEEELIMDAGTWNSEGFFAKKYDSLEDFAKFVEKTYGGNHKRHLSDLMKMKSKGIIKIETNESISLNEGKVFFGGY